MAQFGRRKAQRPFFLRWMLQIPFSATGPYWRRWKRMAKRRAPIRYFLQRDLPPALKAWRRRYVRDPISWIRHRTTDRYNVVKIRSLKPRYHEFDTRLLHASFALLVEYVEDGLAYRNFSWWDQNAPAWRKRLPEKLADRLPYHRTRERRRAAGMSYLNWEISDPACAGSQASTAMEVKDMYLWWTVERPARIEPWGDERIWENARSEEGEDFLSMFSTPGRRGQKSLRRVAGDHAHHTEEFYHAQDQAMLKRLVEVRRGLWT